jgi:prolyl-tRNA editing enzyme YbaK/EbsC (Cys-tRNA(Pro) deacylase)
MSRSVDRVRKALAELGVETKIRHYPQGTRTAADAAAAIGVPLGSIVKSLVFMVSGDPVLVLVAGDQRADVTKLAKLLDVSKADIQFADADTVRAATGFAIGGVPPVGHQTNVRTLIDETLGRFDVVHAAAGTPSANFPIPFEELVEVTGGQLADLADRQQ